MPYKRGTGPPRGKSNKKVTTSKARTPSRGAPRGQANRRAPTQSRGVHERASTATATTPRTANSLMSLATSTSGLKSITTTDLKKRIISEREKTDMFSQVLGFDLNDVVTNMSPATGIISGWKDEAGSAGIISGWVDEAGSAGLSAGATGGPTLTAGGSGKDMRIALSPARIALGTTEYQMLTNRVHILNKSTNLKMMAEILTYMRTGPGPSIPINDYSSYAQGSTGQYFGNRIRQEPASGVPSVSINPSHTHPSLDRTSPSMTNYSDEAKRFEDNSAIVSWLSEENIVLAPKVDDDDIYNTFPNIIVERACTANHFIDPREHLGEKSRFIREDLLTEDQVYESCGNCTIDSIKYLGEADFESLDRVLMGATTIDQVLEDIYNGAAQLISGGGGPMFEFGGADEAGSRMTSETLGGGAGTGGPDVENTAAMAPSLYLYLTMIKYLDVFIGFERSEGGKLLMKSPIFVPITQQIVDQIDRTGLPALCKFRPFKKSSPTLGEDALPMFNSCFLLAPGELQEYAETINPAVGSLYTGGCEFFYFEEEFTVDWTGAGSTTRGTVADYQGYYHIHYDGTIMAGAAHDASISQHTLYEYTEYTGGATEEILMPADCYDDTPVIEHIVTPDTGSPYIDPNLDPRTHGITMHGDALTSGASLYGMLQAQGRTLAQWTGFMASTVHEEIDNYYRKGGPLRDHSIIEDS